jgi:hypothetical protein
VLTHIIQKVDRITICQSELTRKCTRAGIKIIRCILGAISETGDMPLIDVTYHGTVSEELLRRLAEVLPDAVAEAVGCPEDPWTGPTEPGDIEIRFRRKSQLDVGDLDVVIEVRTKLFGHRVQDKQRRADLIRDRLSRIPLGQVGVWLILSEGAWSQRPWRRRIEQTTARPGHRGARPGSSCPSDRSSRSPVGSLGLRGVTELISGDVITGAHDLVAFLLIFPTVAFGLLAGFLLVAPGNS